MAGYRISDDAKNPSISLSFSKRLEYMDVTALTGWLTSWMAAVAATAAAADVSALLSLDAFTSRCLDLTGYWGQRTVTDTGIARTNWPARGEERGGKGKDPLKLFGCDTCDRRLARSVCHLISSVHMSNDVI
ncbi:hypothetical protein V1477_006733 [Vespula maculifrons]|uniref:C2H2-type domain-containing protein n=1 Tax=Vespula maculifrons TaxID=7453 RepID=A0ABD2CGJ4_VESMC